jgi:hypothetical protein
MKNKIESNSTELKYKFHRDTVFKTMFVKNPDLLKQWITYLLGTSSINNLHITNPELIPNYADNKLCRLDINNETDIL